MVVSPFTEPIPFRGNSAGSLTKSCRELLALDEETLWRQCAAVFPLGDVDPVSGTGFVRICEWEVIMFQ